MTDATVVADNEQLHEIIERCRSLEGPLLPILNEVQKRFGHISEDDLKGIAEALNLTRAEVYGVVSFYHDFKLKPVSARTLKICRAEACQARGVEKLLRECGLEGRSDVRLESVYCLGLCAVGPAVLTEDGEVHARLDATALSRLAGGVS